MSRYFEKIRHYYQCGLYSGEQIRALANKGAITPEEAEEILKD